MHVYGELIGTLTSSGRISGFLSVAEGISGTLTIPSAVGVEVYAGPYEFTPTEEPQTAAVQNKLSTQNIVINPIPTNYGLITWDGTKITVS